MLGGTMLPLFAVCTFTLHNLPAGNMVTTLNYSSFYVCMLCDSVQVGTEELDGCGKALYLLCRNVWWAEYLIS